MSSCMLLKDVQTDVYKPITVILYGCEAWSVTLSDKHRLTGLATWVIGRIFVTSGEGATGRWRKLHYEEVNDLYSPPNITGMITDDMCRDS